MNDLGLPVVVLLTHVDLILEEQGRASTSYNSQNVYSAVEAASVKMSVPKSHVLPVINYETEVELDTEVDILALLALRQILRFADGYFDELRGRIGGPTTESKTKLSDNYKTLKAEKLFEPS